MAQARNWYEPGIKNDFEEMEHEFAIGIFHPENRTVLFRCSVALETLLLERPNKLFAPFTFQPDFPETF